MGYTVGHLAKLTGVTVRTLHHYGRLGLLVPRDRSGAGYRRYADEDLERLRNILFYREFGFSLGEIASILDEPDGSTNGHLRRQRELLAHRILRLQTMIAAVDKELEAHAMGIQLTPEEKFEIFGPNYSDDYEAEAEERWGETPAWQQSQSRTARFSKQDWARIKESGDDLNRRLAHTMASGAAPSSAAAMDLAEEHHRSIEVFYDCPYAMHRGLGDMYLSDERFTRTYEEVAPGLARWLRDAIHANADRRDVAGR